AAFRNTTLMGGSGTAGTFQYWAKSNAAPTTTWRPMATGMSQKRMPRLLLLVSSSIREFSNISAPLVSRQPTWPGGAGRGESTLTPRRGRGVRAHRGPDLRSAGGTGGGAG